MADYTARFEEVRASAAVAKVWERYVNDTPYAQGIEFDEVANAVLELGNMAIG